MSNMKGRGASNQGKMSLSSTGAASFTPDYSSMIIVDDIPIVGRDKEVRLKERLCSFFSQIGPLDDECDFHMPFEEGKDGGGEKSLGFCFMKFQHAEDAAQAIQKANGVEVLKNVRITVTPYASLVNIKQPAPINATFRPTPDCTPWLADPELNEHFAIRFDRETNIFSISPQFSASASQSSNAPQVIYNGERERVGNTVWCEKSIAWSSQGSFFFTFHPKGIVLWSAVDFSKQSRFEHDGAYSLSVSPCERHLYTVSYTTIRIWSLQARQDLGESSLLREFDVRSEYLESCLVEAVIITTLPSPPPSSSMNNNMMASTAPLTREKTVFAKVVSFDGQDVTCVVLGKSGSSSSSGNTTIIKKSLVTPLVDFNKLQWSASGDYIARLDVDRCGVYCVSGVAASGVRLLDDRSIDIPGLVDCAWSSLRDVLAYWQSPIGTNGLDMNCIVLIKMPTKEVVYSKSMLNVTQTSLNWQNNGRYLAVIITKNLTRLVKQTLIIVLTVSAAGVTGIEIELDDDVVHAFSWEGRGNRFAILTSSSSSSSMVTRKSLLICQVNPTTPTTQAHISKLHSLPYPSSTAQTSQLSWSPRGSALVLATSSSSSLLSYDFIDASIGKCVSSRSHECGTGLSWDPSGRWFMTISTIPMSKTDARLDVDTHINIYDVRGQLVWSSGKLSKLYQFEWRPRPKCLLTEADEHKLINSPEKLAMIEIEQERAIKLKARERLMVRRQMLTDFKRLTIAKREVFDAAKGRRIELRDGYDEDDGNNFTDDVHLYELVVAVSEEVLPDVPVASAGKRVAK